MEEILEEEECKDTYGRIRMYQALTMKQLEHLEIPSEPFTVSWRKSGSDIIPGANRTRSRKRTGKPESQTISENVISTQRNH